MPLGQFWVILGKRMATIRAISGTKTAGDTSLFVKSDPKVTHLAKMTQNGDSRIDVS